MVGRVCGGVAGPSGEIGGDGGVEQWSGQTRVAGQLGDHLLASGSIAQRVGERSVEPELAARDERRVAHGPVHVVGERVATRSGPGPDQPGCLGPLERVEHVSRGAVERRSDERHVNLITGDRGDVDDLKVARTESVEAVRHHLAERPASRTLACKFAQEQGVPTVMRTPCLGSRSPPTASIRLAAAETSRPAKGSMSTDGRPASRPRNAPNPSPTYGGASRVVTSIISGASPPEREIRAMTSLVPAVAQCRSSTTNSSRRAQAAAGQEIVERTLHRRPLALRIDDVLSGDAEAGGDVRRQPGERSSLHPESPFELVVGQLSQICLDRGHEWLVRALRSVRANAERHATTATVHFGGNIGGQARLADPCLAADDSDRRSPFGAIPAGEKLRPLPVAAETRPTLRRRHRADVGTHHPTSVTVDAARPF